MLSPIAKAAAAAGHDAYVCYCPFNPAQKIDHVLIPSLSLAFLTVNDHLIYPDDTERHIRLDAYIDHERYLELRENLRQWKKIHQTLLQSAVSSLHESKNLHDKLETFYVPAMDFEKVDHFFNELCPKILSRL